MGNWLYEIPKILLKTFKLEVNVIDLLNEFQVPQLYLSFILCAWMLLELNMKLKCYKINSFTDVMKQYESNLNELGSIHNFFIIFLCIHF